MTDVVVNQHPELSSLRANAWRELLPAAAKRELRLAVVRSYPLSEAAEALRFVREGHAAGKVVLIPDPGQAPA